MATQIRTDDVPIVAQFLRDPVPIMRMILSPMNQHEKWRIGISPIQIMKRQPL